MPSVHVSRHPLLLHRVGLLRDVNTPPREFRRLVREIAHLLFWEATAELAIESHIVTTPLSPCPAERVVQRIGLVPILRAGLGMADAIVEFVPDAQVWHLGLYRDHKTLKPVTYYNKLTRETKLDICYVVDPMLATGGSAAAAIDILKGWDIRNIRFLAIIAAPEGVRALQAAHPDVKIFLAALDSHLNEHSYIVPGLGDAGDRQFGTLC
ncbi:MAG: uracil phosphoribosyltransferase [Gemmataceae bacterium]|nr:uracil phosphoribosyltransferase [Gemmataceae bacterium]